MDELTHAELVDLAVISAADDGTTDGAGAASWFFDASTSQETYAATLAAINDGDPAVMDRAPNPLSGEWGGDKLPHHVTRDALSDAAWRLGIDLRGMETSERDALEDNATDEVSAAYCDAFSDAYWQEVERVARYHLGA